MIFVSAVGGDKILAGDRAMLLPQRPNLAAAAQVMRTVISAHPAAPARKLGECHLLADSANSPEIWERG